MAEEESQSLLEMTQRSHVTNSSTSTYPPSPSTSQTSSSTPQPPIAGPQHVSVLMPVQLTTDDIDAPQRVSVLMPVQLTDEDNYLLWKSFFLPILGSHNMLDLAEGREKCPPQFLSGTEDRKKVENPALPAYTDWIRRDLTFLVWINVSISKGLLLRYATGCTSGRALWLTFEKPVANKARARVEQLKDQLRDLKMERPYEFRMEEYIYSANQIADNLHAMGSPVEDDEFVSYVLRGLLPQECDELKASIRDRPEPVTREELNDLLLNHRFPVGPVDKIISIFCVVVILLLPLGLLFGLRGKIASQN